MSQLIRQQSGPYDSPRNAVANQNMHQIGPDQYIAYEQPTLDAERICQDLECHKSFEIHPGLTVKDLLKAYDLTAYGKVTDEMELKLCKAETHRLVAAVN